MNPLYFFSKTTRPWVRSLALLVLSGWLLATTAQGQTFTLTTGAANPFNGIDVGVYSRPSLGDVNGDGKLDVVVGESDGTLFYFKNTGTATAPVYTQQTGTNNPFNGIDVGEGSAPSLGDVNGDGKLDVVIGKEAEGSFKLVYYKNTGTTTAPVYTQQTGANNPFDGIAAGTTAAPNLGDVHGDGKIDLVLGIYDSDLPYFKNTGTATAPVYTQQTGANNPFNGVDVGTVPVPSLGDVDGDGDLDLVVGEFLGNLYYYKNTGTATAPVYVKQTGAANPFNGVDFSDFRYVAPSLGDVNGDGNLDAVVGEYDGTLYYFKNTRLVITQQPSPASQAVCVGGNASSTVAASGAGTLTYAWYRNQPDTDEPVSGQTTATLSLTGVQLAQAGLYYARVTGSGSTVWSQAFTLTVNALPVVSITGLASSYCKDASAVTLTGSPSGGSFTIDGNAATSFNPASLSVGPHSVVYSYTDGNSCSASASQTVTVNALPVVSITGLASSYCKDASAVTLAGSPAGGSFTIDGNAATSFNPASLSVGPHSVVYSYTDGNSCSASASQTVTVNALPVVSITGLASSFCKDATAVTLAGSPASGSFTIDGNAATSFNPASLSVGPHTVIYSYTDGNSCSASASQTVTVNALPVVSITGLASSYCKDASAITLAGSPAGGSFTLDGNAATSFDPASLALGEHTVIYSYTDANTCRNTASQTVTVNALPVVSITGLASSFCKNATAVTLVGSPAGGSFTIDGNATTSFDPASLSVGPHTVGYSYTDGNSCSASASQTVTVTQPVFTSPATVSGGPVCAGTSVLLSFAFFCPDNASFTAELTTAAGMPVGIPLGSVTPGSHSVTIPAGTPTGSYLILVTSSNPTLTSLSNAFGVTGLSANFNSTPTVSQVPACAGGSFRVSFTQAAAPACSFPQGNVFSAQLSDASGSFAAPVSLGQISPGINPLTVPQNTPTGSGYRVRIAATTGGSSAYSTPSAAFTVTQPTFSSTPTVSLDNKCAGEGVRLSFSIGCAFFAGNTFTAQLSNASGVFAAIPVSLGLVTPGASNTVVIPAGTPAGTGYKIRVVSSNPEVTSAVSANFKVKACGSNRETAPEEAGLRVVVSPNPSPEGRLRITVSGAEGQALRVDLFNGLGQSVRERRIPKAGEEEVLDWDVSRQPAGLYLLRVSDGREAKTLKVLH